MLTFLGILGLIGLIGIAFRIAWPILKVILFIVGTGMFIGMLFTLLIF
jgi:hypothetical protein